MATQVTESQSYPGPIPRNIFLNLERTRLTRLQAVLKNRSRIPKSWLAGTSKDEQLTDRLAFNSAMEGAR